MKTIEEVEELEIGDTVYDKFSLDISGEPLKWTVDSPFIRSRHLETFFLVKLKVDGDPADITNTGFTTINNENYWEFTTDYASALASCGSNMIEEGNKEGAERLLKKALSEL